MYSWTNLAFFVRIVLLIYLNCSIFSSEYNSLRTSLVHYYQYNSFIIAFISCSNQSHWTIPLIAVLTWPIRFCEWVNWPIRKQHFIMMMELQNMSRVHNQINCSQLCTRGRSWHILTQFCKQDKRKSNKKFLTFSDDRHRVQRLVFSLSLPDGEQNWCRRNNRTKRKTSKSEFISFGRSYQKFVGKTPGSCFSVQSWLFRTIPGEILTSQKF